MCSKDHTHIHAPSHTTTQSHAHTHAHRQHTHKQPHHHIRAHTHSHTQKYIHTNTYTHTHNQLTDARIHHWARHHTTQQTHLRTQPKGCDKKRGLHVIVNTRKLPAGRRTQHAACRRPRPASRTTRLTATACPIKSMMPTVRPINDGVVLSEPSI